MDPIVFLGSVKTISATTLSIIRLIDYFAGHEPLHVKERLGRSLELMSKYMHEKNQSKNPGDAWRNDWFPENQVSNHRTLRRLIEKTVKEIINDSQEKKSEQIAKFLVNICLTSNSDIDEATAFSYFEVIESLSWRQLCIIRVIMLCESGEVDIRHIRDEDVEQMPQDERTRFYSISREYEKLKDDRYIMSSEFGRSEENYDPFLNSPSYGWLPDYTSRLHSLMNLDEIPIEDIIKIFSPWNITPKKTRRIRKNPFIFALQAPRKIAPITQIYFFALVYFFSSNITSIERKIAVKVNANVTPASKGSEKLSKQISIIKCPPAISKCPYDKYFLYLCKICKNRFIMHATCFFIPLL